MHAALERNRMSGCIKRNLRVVKSEGTQMTKPANPLEGALLPTAPFILAIALFRIRNFLLVFIVVVVLHSTACRCTVLLPQLPLPLPILRSFLRSLLRSLLIPLGRTRIQ